MISIPDQVALRRATALSHFVPNFGFRIRHGHSILAEVGRNLSPASHRLVGACEFRRVLSATSVEHEVPESLSYLANRPLHVDWTMAFPGHLHSSGLIETTLTSGQTRWVFATMTDRETLASIVDELTRLNPQLPHAGQVTRFRDTDMDISLVVVDVLDECDPDACRATAEAVLREAMAQELLA